MIKTTACILLALLPVLDGRIASADDATPAPARAAQTTLPRVVVTGTRTEDNYRVETVDSLGPLGTTKILDTPYSIGILPLDLIENSLHFGAIFGLHAFEHAFGLGPARLQETLPLVAQPLR